MSSITQALTCYGRTPEQPHLLPTLWMTCISHTEHNHISGTEQARFRKGSRGADALQSSLADV